MENWTEESLIGKVIVDHVRSSFLSEDFFGKFSFALAVHAQRHVRSYVRVSTHVQTVQDHRKMALVKITFYRVQSSTVQFISRVYRVSLPLYKAVHFISFKNSTER